MPIQYLNYFTSNPWRPRSGGRNQLQRAVAAQAKAMRTEFLRELWRQLRCWHQRRVASAELYALDDAALKDIGLHRSGIEAALDRSASSANPQKRRGFAENQPFSLPQRPAPV